ncbi:MAG: barstar family protein [Roseburia sp.]|nr:barstar family protein [Roseburia sp.]
MRICVLDGRDIRDKEALHDMLTVALKLPDWYGRNMDALYDCLTDVQEETEFRILHEREMEEHLGNYARVLRAVIRRAAETNPRICWNING